MWDLVVVGGGPAGSAAALRALQLRPDARVLIVDRADFPRDKPCGDGVAPHALDVLADLGVGAGEIVDGFAPVNRLRLTSPTGYVAARGMRRSAYVIPGLFSTRGCSPWPVVAVRTSAAIASAPCSAPMMTWCSTAPLEPGWSWAPTAPSPRCDGCSVCRRTARACGGGDRGYAAVPAGGAGEQVITMTGERWPAYAWSFPIGDGRANVGYGEVLRGHRSGAIDCCSGSASWCPASEPDPTTLRAHRLPLSSSRPRVRGGPVLLAGDASVADQPDDRGGHLLRRPVRRTRRRGRHGWLERRRSVSALLRRNVCTGTLRTRPWCPGSAVGRGSSTAGCSVRSGISACSTTSSSSGSATVDSRCGPPASAVGKSRSGEDQPQRDGHSDDDDHAAQHRVRQPATNPRTEQAAHHRTDRNEDRDLPVDGRDHDEEHRRCQVHDPRKNVLECVDAL